jgi:hypothetical protein
MLGIMRAGSRRRHEEYCRWFNTLTPTAQIAERARRHARDSAIMTGLGIGFFLGLLFGAAFGLAIAQHFK